MQQFIVLATPDGIVDMTPEAIAGRTTIPLDIIRKGIAFLEQPDPYSRTPGEDGKRIVLLDDHRNWGWRLVNHWKYMALRNMRQKRADDRARIAEKRNKNKNVATVSQNVANVAHLDSDLDLNKSKDEGRAIALPDWLPLEPWKAWLEVRKKMRAPNTARALQLALRDLERFRALGQDPGAVLDQAVARGWRGLFALKANGEAPQQPLAKKLCAYCGGESSGSVGGTYHCARHLEDAMDRKPIREQ